MVRHEWWYVGALLALQIVVPRAGEAQTATGQRLYEQRCSTCHEHTDSGSRIPSRRAIQELGPEAILSVLGGAMAAHADGLNENQKTALAEFVAGRPMGSLAGGDASATANACASAEPIKGSTAQFARWNGWSPDQTNSRFQPLAAAGLTAQQVPRLKLKWAFGFPGATSVWTQPTVVDGRLFASSNAGFVYSLSAKTGCVHWAYKAETGVRTPVVVQAVSGVPNVRFGAFFGDMHGNVYGVDADTGKLLWRRRVEEHPLARITGGIQLWNGRLLVPVASFEETSANSESYQCCTFRGSIVALEAKSGEPIWKTYTISQEPQPTKKSAAGVQLYGPAGGAVWNTPTIDPQRGELYIGTGNAYTAPAPVTTGAVMAIDLETGRILWSHQVVANDAWVIGCGRFDRQRTDHCPDRDLQNEFYFDVDMAASPILRRLADGRRVLITAGEAGLVNALDPALKGEVVWKADLGEIVIPKAVTAGESQRGIGFGGAADDRTVYFPLERREGGLVALSLENGKAVWAVPGEKPADDTRGGQPAPGAQQSAATTIDGVVFSGSGDGTLRAYSTTNGQVLWRFETARKFETVNRVPGQGGAIGGPGVTVADGMVFTGSGYGRLGAAPGNVLLAFGIE